MECVYLCHSTLWLVVLCFRELYTLRDNNHLFPLGLHVALSTYVMVPLALFIFYVPWVDYSFPPSVVVLAVMLL